MNAAMGASNNKAYQVVLPIFEGPLDLLLHLIEREELDITQVSLALITNQFLDYTAQLGERDPDRLADFLVVAAKLLLIKSRVLLPRPSAPLSLTDDLAAEDVGQDLVQQLVEYRKFREVAHWLQEIEAQGLHSYVRVSSLPLERTLDLDGATMDDLLAAVRLVLRIKPPEPSVNGTVAPLTLTIAEQMDLIARETARGGSVSFLQLISDAKSHLEVIVTLLALLEMIKRRRVTVRQDTLFGDVLISKREQEDRQALLAETESP